MKIKVCDLSYKEVLSLPKQAHEYPKKQSAFFRILLKAFSAPELWSVSFSCKESGMEKLGKNEPCLYLMNHSSFIDMKIAVSVIYPRPFNIVCTSDGFVGKKSLMRALGCIPTNKFVPDVMLLRDMTYALHTLKSSVLMYPEAGYSFDGTAATLPSSLGKCLKMLGVPVVMIKTQGAFARDPLYNNLQKRKVTVTAEETYILSPEEIKSKSVSELNELLKAQFTFDNFRWQQENNIRITEEFRADGLNRVLYKCPNCKCEGQMRGKGIRLSCDHCKKTYYLDEFGFMQSESGITEFKHIPDWYNWERECVKKEITDGSYHLKTDVRILALVNSKCLYSIGSGTLEHNDSGFHLTGCNGELDYTQKAIASYGLNSDYYWYEIGDMICIGNNDILYYCFPASGNDIVAKTRIATEEMYKIAFKNKFGTT